MFCTISQEICEQPVISKKTGHIYEKSLLEKHLKITGKCPVTEDDMTMDDVVEVKGYQQPAQPKPPTASSIPVLLKTLQNEVFKFDYPCTNILCTILITKYVFKLYNK